MVSLDSRRWRCAGVSAASVGEGVGLLYSISLSEEVEEEEGSSDIYVRD